MAAKVSKIEANVIDDKLLCEGLIIDKNLTEAEKAAGAGDINLVESGIYYFNFIIIIIIIIISTNCTIINIII